MTKKEYVNALLSNFDITAEEVPCTSGPGTVKKLSYTKSAFELLLYFILNDEHIIWKENGTRSGRRNIRKG